MSECVVRMAMPSKNKSCGMAFDFDGIWYCPVKGRICRQPDNGEIPSFCPIICSLPEGHGRLVDADAAESIIRKWFEEIKLNPDILLDGVKSLPTIVPAEAERSQT